MTHLLDVSQEQQLTQSLSLSCSSTPQTWKIGKCLGGGASGNVYKALNINTMQIAAVKQILTQKDKCEQIVVLSKLQHPNIVRYIQHCHRGNETWIFIEYVPYNLQQFYQNYGAPPYSVYIHFARQLINALDYLHRNNVVHKDVKCQNVLLSEKGVLKLTDYGSSKSFDKSIFLKQYETEIDNTFRGTSNWMAPESILQGQYTRKSDVWNLGCTLLELATTKKPWSETKIQDQRIIYYIGTNNTTPQIPPTLHPNTITLLQHCLKRNAEDRMNTQQLLSLLNTFEQ